MYLRYKRIIRNCSQYFSKINLPRKYRIAGNVSLIDDSLDDLPFRDEISGDKLFCIYALQNYNHTTFGIDMEHLPFSVKQVIVFSAPIAHIVRISIRVSIYAIQNYNHTTFGIDMDEFHSSMNLESQYNVIAKYTDYLMNNQLHQN